MELRDLPSDRIILILGAPRSGTSWLAKIFDSHPDVVYRHEPDSVVRNHTIPWMCQPEDIPAYRDAAEAYLRQMIGVATLKSAGSLPIFAKRYHGTLTSRLRSCMIYGLHATELVGGFRKLTQRAAIPDRLDLARSPDIRLVMKSVSSRGRARLYAEALPSARIIFIVRDPFGQISSMLRGAALGKFEDGVPVEEVLQTQEARRYGLTSERFNSLPLVEQLAWNWAILNEKAIHDLADVETARVLYYQDLGTNPLAESRALFEFAGLSWEPQTADFIRRSTTSSGPDRYYKIFKNPTQAMTRWRRELSLEDQRRIFAIVRQTSLAPIALKSLPSRCDRQPRVLSQDAAFGMMQSNGLQEFPN